MNEMRHKSKTIQISESLSNAKTLFWLAVVLAGFIGVLLFFYKGGAQVNPPEYEGKIVEKWAGYTHSDQGSTPYFRLLVETAGGQRSTVAVDKEIYNRANVGMWIKKSRKGIELSFATRNSSSLTACLPPTRKFGCHKTIHEFTRTNTKTF